MLVKNKLTTLVPSLWARSYPNTFFCEAHTFLVLGSVMPHQPKQPYVDIEGPSDNSAGSNATNLQKDYESERPVPAGISLELSLTSVQE